MKNQWIKPSLFSKLLCLLMAVGMTFSLFGCHKDDNNRTPGTTAPSLPAGVPDTVQAVQVGDHSLSLQELHYYYYDAINNYLNYNYQMYSGYGNYWTLFLGFDLTKPLNEQDYNEEAGTNWSDFFLEQAENNARLVYAAADLAEKENYALSEEENSAVENLMTELDAYAKQNGYESGLAYLKKVYGPNASAESYQEYYRRSILASSYYNAYAEALEFTEEELEAFEADKAVRYNSYSFATYSISVSAYLQGGTKDENGKITYSEEEKAAALAAAKKDMELLTAQKTNTVEGLNSLIQGLEVGEKSCKENSRLLYSNISDESLRQWISDPARQVGEITALPIGTEQTTRDGGITGYTVVLFLGSADNRIPLVNVRHMLVKFSGGTKDSITGAVTYSDEEKAQAKEKAEALLAQWQAGAATEETFGALATEKTEDPGSKNTGGLYKDIYPGQMVQAFNDWCFDESRQPGDVGLVQTQYGYHIMFFSARQEQTYRESMLRSDLLQETMSKWEQALMETTPCTELDLSGLDRAFVCQKTSDAS